MAYTGNITDTAGRWCTLKTVIYLDILLLVNFLAAYFLLMAAGLLTAQRAKFWRMLCASALAALSALILFAPELPYALQVVYKLLTAAGIVAAAFGVREWRRYLAATCWYAALNILLAGLAILAVLRTGTTAVQTANLALYLRVPPLLLILLSGLCSILIEIVLRFLRPVEPEPQTVGLEFELCGVAVRVRAYLDTGCCIKDPITCLPVLLISYPAARSRLPAEICGFLDGWFAGSRQTGMPPQTNLRLIPCATAAENSLLPGFAVAEIGRITDRGLIRLGRSAVAFSPQEFGGGHYEALFGNGFL